MDLKLLNDKVKQSGRSPNDLAAAWGVSLPTYYKMLNGESEFKASAIKAATEALGLTREERDAIFFGE